jgi:hypothetical protein
LSRHVPDIELSETTVSAGDASLLKRLVREHPENSRRQRGRVARRDEQSISVVFNHLDNTARARRNHRHTGGKRLENRESLGLDE